MLYCDNCGDEENSHEEHRAYSKLPFDIDSANAGESGIVCVPCDRLKLQELS